MEQQDSIFTDHYNHEVESSYGVKFLSKLIDFIIEILLMIILITLYIIALNTGYGSVNSLITYILAFVVIFTYRLCFIFLFGKTIGMMLCRLKYLNSNLLELIKKEKFIVVFLTGVSNIKLYKMKTV